MEKHRAVQGYFGEVVLLCLMITVHMYVRMYVDIGTIHSLIKYCTYLGANVVLCSWFYDL